MTTAQSEGAAGAEAPFATELSADDDACALGVHVHLSVLLAGLQVCVRLGFCLQNRKA